MTRRRNIARDVGKQSSPSLQISPHLPLKKLSFTLQYPYILYIQELKQRIGESLTALDLLLSCGVRSLVGRVSSESATPYCSWWEEWSGDRDEEGTSWEQV